MDSLGKLKLKWACGYQATSLHFVAKDVVVYGSGNILNFVQASTGNSLRSVPSEGKGIGPITVSRESGLIAYAEASLEPLIFVLNYPKCSVVHSLKGDAKLEYKSLAFSSNGQKLASLSGIPDFILTIWNLKDGIDVCKEVVDHNLPAHVTISFNPINWKQLLLYGDDRIRLWSVETCDTQMLLTSISIELPEKLTPVGTVVQATSSLHSSQQGTGPIADTNGGRTSKEGLSEGALDMMDVYYDKTYSERVRKKYPVIPVSHCWTNQSQVYIGFKGGQLMMIDVDSSSMKILINQSQEVTSTSTVLEDENTPKTAHALLCEGSVDCLTLSHRGLITAGKDGHIYCFNASNDFRMIDSFKFNHYDDIVTMSCHECVVVGTKTGCAFRLDLDDFSHHTAILEYECARLVGVDVLSPGTKHCVTCREDGLVQVWDILKGGHHLSSLHLQTECTSLVCPISSQSVIIGTQTGHLLLLSYLSIETPTLVHKMRLFRNSVSKMKCDVNGRFIVCSSEEERSVYICSAQFHKEGIQMLGYTDISSPIQDIVIIPKGWDVDEYTQIAVHSTASTLHQTSTSSTASSSSSSPSIITQFNIPNKLATETIDSIYEDAATKVFSNQSISKKHIYFSVPILSMILAPHNEMFVVPRKTKSLCKITMPLKDKGTITEDDLKTSFPAHELSGSRYCLSFHQKWLLSIGQDGKGILRQIEKPLQMLLCFPHHYKNEGGSHAVLSTDGQYLLTVGDKAALTCWQWGEVTQHSKVKLSEAMQYAEGKLQQLSDIIEKQNAIFTVMPELKQFKEQLNEQTWLEIATELAHKAEDEKYDELKSQLRAEINALREKVMSMIENNEKLNEMEKLERSEFILDTEEHQRHQREEEEKISSLKEEIELANLAKMYLHSLIKRQCWNDMKIKGKTIKAFQHRFEVTNYPLKEQSMGTVSELERVKTFRRIELVERKVRDAVMSDHKQSVKSQIPSLDLGLEEEDDSKKDEKDLEPHTLMGSRAAEHGATTELLYDQFELVSPVTKRNQIILLQECLRSVKETFNKEFDEVLHQKTLEIARIQEKNIRIKKISNDLKLNEEIFDPKLDSDEEPERLLKVTDEEVEIEKYISPEERKRLEEVAKEEEERKIREMGDNWRERGLDMMMAGRLEANAEEELFKDLPRPDFMFKDVSEMTEDEIRMKHEFEKKEAAWLEEREKMKKALEAEMRKHQENISQGVQAFDDKVMKLFQLKVETEKAVLEEELKILRLSASLLVEEEIKLKEELLEKALNDKKNAKALVANTILSTKKQLEEHQEVYEQMISEDKELEKAFKKDFTDCEPHIDLLLKLFKRRPRGLKLKAEPVTEVKSDNPSTGSIHVRPSGGVMTVTGSSTWTVEEIMSDLDNPSNMPEGLELYQWERFIVARHNKVESERRVKEMAMRLAEINAFLHKREKESEQLQADIQNNFVELNRLHDDKALCDLNVEIQLLLKQGQVEIGASDFAPDFSNSVLIHRSGVEELNNQIKTLGEAKLAHMMECKDFKKSIRMLEWELKRLHMEAEDLINKAKDIQMLRVTKELQERLMMDNIQRKDQHQIETLEKTIKLNQKIHKKRLRNFSKILNSLKDNVEKKKTANTEIEKELEEKAVEVAERQNIKDLADGSQESEDSSESRMRDIVSRRKLVELAKTQANEIGILRQEVERLRMKTFPALVQVENLF